MIYETNSFLRLYKTDVIVYCHTDMIDRLQTKFTAAIVVCCSHYVSHWMFQIERVTVAWHLNPMVGDNGFYLIEIVGLCGQCF